MARVAFMNEQIGRNWNWLDKGLVLRQNLVEYLQPVYLNDTVVIEIVPVSCGRTSFTLEYLLFANDQLTTTGRSVLVCYNFEKKLKNEVYPEFKKLFDTL
jgi:acyl-CoA thioesterase FadM